ncbi:hypothetical protein [Cellvibrio sp. UBA7661]|uniref:hypothetical protein n=1 Tax=Cellvibrio sp. UBA7661 TaxID=1946311 RepID=UPI002F360A8C
MRTPKSKKPSNKTNQNKIKSTKNKKLETIFVGLLGLMIFIYGLKSLLIGEVIAHGSDWRVGWEANGAAAFFIALAISLFGIGVMYAAFKNWDQ